jgi:hypothetical protein
MKPSSKKHAPDCPRKSDAAFQKRVSSKHPMRTLLCLAALAFVMATPQVMAGETSEKRSDAKMITRVLRIWPRQIAGVVPGLNDYPPPTRPSFAALPLPDTADGQKRWELSPMLKEIGIETGPGTEAILLNYNTLVMTNTQQQINRLEIRLAPANPIRCLEVEASLWEFNSFANKNRLRRFAQLKAAAGKSLRRLDTVRVLTMSGNKVVAVSKQPGPEGDKPPVQKAEPSKDTADADSTATSLGNARGTVFEVEPVLGPDGVQFETLFNYQARLPRGDGQPDFEITHSASVSIPDKQDSVVYFAPAPAEDGKPKHTALVLRARMVEADGRTKEERKAGERRETELLIKKARAGLPPRK